MCAIVSCAVPHSCIYCRRQLGLTGSQKNELLRKKIYFCIATDVDVPERHATESLHKLSPGDVLLKVNGMDPVATLQNLQKTNFQVSRC